MTSVDEILSENKLSEEKIIRQLILDTDIKPLFILYSAVWCNPCKIFKPLFKKESENNKNITFHIADVSNIQNILIEHKISKIPIIKIFYKNKEQEEITANSLLFKKSIEKWSNLKDI